MRPFRCAVPVPCVPVPRMLVPCVPLPVVLALLLVWCPLVCVAVTAGTSRAAASEAARTAPVVLSVDGAIAAPGFVNFTRADLARLGLHRIETVTPWSDTATVFEGPLLRRVLEHVRARGDTLKAVALNDYRITIPVSDARRHDVILAISENGKALGVRERGPVRVVYPWSADPDLRSELYYSRAIWQMRRLTVLPKGG